jgi:hypothetical protein
LGAQPAERVAGDRRRGAAEEQGGPHPARGEVEPADRQAHQDEHPPPQDRIGAGEHKVGERGLGIAQDRHLGQQQGHGRGDDGQHRGQQQQAARRPP